MSIAMNKIDVSIIIVTWNRQALLGEALQAAQLASARLNAEIILVDNASNDGTMEMVARDFPSVKVIKLHKNMGPIFARNIGAADARGEILCFFDDDLIVTREALDQLLNKFPKDDELAAVSAKVINVFSGGVESDYYRPEKDEDLMVWNFHNEGAVAFRKKALLQANYYCDEYFREGESQELSRRFYSLGYHIMYSPTVEVHHKHSPVSRNEKQISWLSIRNTIWNDLLEYDAPLTFFILIYRIIRSLPKAASKRLAIPDYLRAVKEGIFNVPWHRKIKLDKKTRTLMDQLKINKGISLKGSADLRIERSDYIWHKARNLLRGRN